MRNVNICFQDGTYEKIKDLVERRKISQFVNEAVEEKIRHEEEEIFNQKQKEEAEIRKKLAEGYRKNASNKKMRKEMEIWDETVEDVLGCIDRKKNERAK
jgi:hypothetical protein